MHVFRLTNVFGKWARPNYNSAVATFCHNIARGQPIKGKVGKPLVPMHLAEDGVLSLGCKIDGGQHKVGSYTHEDAEVIAATVAGMPDSLGGKRLARLCLQRHGAQNLDILDARRRSVDGKFVETGRRLFRAIIRDGDVVTGCRIEIDARCSRHAGIQQIFAGQL